MAERLNKCPKCQSTYLKTMKLHNPETCDMNCNATLRCEDCKHEWEGLVRSPNHQRDRDMGFAR